MPEMILGLDLGSDSVKAVLAAVYGRTAVKVLAFETIPAAGGADLDAAIKKIGEVIRPLAPSRLRCVVSLPPADVLFRLIRLPFPDENKIRKTIPFELEPLLPLPIEEVVIDYVHLSDDGLLAAACGKDRIRKVIAAVEAQLGDVSAIDISAAVLVLPLLEQKVSGGAGLVLDIGASSTSAVFYEKNALVQIRSFAFGGKAITGALARDLSCADGEAESRKTAASYGTDIGQTLAVCREFCNSLQNTIEFMRLGKTLQSMPEQIAVTGGGSLFEPLVQELAVHFGTPVNKLDFGIAGRLEIDEKLTSSYLPPVMNTALAAVKREPASRKSFNFRRGEFAVKSVYGGFTKQLRRAAVVAGVILLLAAVDMVLDYAVQAGQANALKNQISQIFRKHYPPTTVMVDPVRQLKTKLVEDRRLYGLDEGAPGGTVLELLKDISGFISPSLSILITHLHYENNMVLLKGEAKKIDDVTAVKNELMKSKRFRNVTVGSTSLGREGGRVDFDLRIEVR